MSFFRKFTFSQIVILSVISSYLIIFVACNKTGQEADSDFDASVSKPALKDKSPRVLFDQAHNNFHTSDGRYKPFATLIANDGCIVSPNKDEFQAVSLKGYDILVIVNAKGKNEQGSDPAFSADECLAVTEWVRAGGSLLLIADHYPFGSAAQILSQPFGIQMSEGGTQDSIHYDTITKNDWTQLVFENGLLSSEHPIIRGRDTTETVRRVITFWGQSLSVPERAVALLKLSKTSQALAPSIKIEKDGSDTRTIVNYGNPTPAFGRAQGVALSFGNGRVVVFGEAAMLTAQLDRDGKKFGMNLSHCDNRQFALNIVRWLAKAI